MVYWNPTWLLAPFGIGFESPFRWLTENPRGSLAPFSIGFDSPLLGGLLETHVAFLTPLALAWIPLFGRFIGNPSGPSGPFSLAL